MPVAGGPSRWALGVPLAALAAGCGSGGGGHPATTTPPGAQSPQPAARAGTPRPAASASATRVIRAWADTLRSGDEIGAARYFAVPSLVQVAPGTPVYRITRRAQAVAFQAVLPCGARLLSAVRQGRYVNALFRLTERPGASCNAPPGATARTDFVIRRGRIREWRRAPDQPGDGRATSGSGASDV